MTFSLGVFYKPECVLLSAIERLTTIAFQAIQRFAEPCGAFGLRQDPFTYCPGWVVPNVLVVHAAQFCHPIALFIGMKSDNRLLHLVPRQFSLQVVFVNDVLIALHQWEGFSIYDFGGYHVGGEMLFKLKRYLFF